MALFKRRSLLQGSLGFAAAGALAQPYVANAQAKTVTLWFAQGFVEDEDVALRKAVADYEKASGNKADSASSRSRRCGRRSLRRSPAVSFPM